MIRHPFLLPLLVLMSMLLSGCETLRQSPQVDLVEPGNYPTQLASAQEAPVLRTTGGLFKASTYRPSFEDRRARMPGDMVTVQISENISARQSSSSSIESLAGTTKNLPCKTPSLL